MAYNITLTDGTAFATIADGTINTDSSVTLVGKNYAGYGNFWMKTLSRCWKTFQITLLQQHHLLDRFGGILATAYSKCTMVLFGKQFQQLQPVVLLLLKRHRRPVV
jgi:hypothetical protein